MSGLEADQAGSGLRTRAAPEKIRAAASKAETGENLLFQVLVVHIVIVVIELFIVIVVRIVVIVEVVVVIVEIIVKIVVEILVALFVFVVVEAVVFVVVEALIEAHGRTENEAEFSCR
ncbi:MAG: hypothetical protein ABFC81_08265 [Rectinema sp.]